MYRLALCFWLLCCLSACQESASTTLFQAIAVEHSNIDFSNDVQETENWNILQYLYFYNGGGVAVGDVNKDGRPDVFFTGQQVSNQLYLNKGDFTFENVTTQAGLSSKGNWSTGATMVDINEDGWLDIFVCVVGPYKSLQGHNLLYINQQDGTFKESAAVYGLDIPGFNQQAAWIDFDRDGDLDVYLLRHSVHSSDRNVVGSMRQERDSLSGDRLLKNETIDGKVRFVDVSDAANIYGGKVGYGLGITTGDFNQDGWVDVYVGNDFREQDYLYINQQNGTFQEVISSACTHTSMFTMGCAAVDWNNDGRLDILTMDMKPSDPIVFKQSAGVDPYSVYQAKIQQGFHDQFARNHLQIWKGNDNKGQPIYQELAQWAGVDKTDWSWSVLGADFDMDGWQDVFITNGILRRPNDLDYLKYLADPEVQSKASDVELANKMPSGNVANGAFKNSPNLQMQAVAKAWGLDLVGSSNGAMYADLDGDGDLDLIVNNLQQKASLYRNTSNETLQKEWLQVNISDEKHEDISLGSTVIAFWGAQSTAQHITSAQGWLSCGEAKAYFAWPRGTQVDSLQVIHRDGTLQVIRQPKLNQTLNIQKSISSIYPTLSGNTAWTELPWSHKEDAFREFNREKLLPFSLATMGPAFAKGDFDGDGFEDCIIGGGFEQSAACWKGTKDGFRIWRQPAFEKDVHYEDVTACVLDWDKDGDLDLFIGSGGNQWLLNHEWLEDRLYLNDGKGQFSRAKSVPFSDRLNTYSAISADVNSDGWDDLVCAYGAHAGAFGVSAGVKIYYGGGKIQPESLETEDMVTQLIWMPSKKSLVTAGLFAPVRIWRKLNTSWTSTALPQSTGMWTYLSIGDINEDGQETILAGNMGLNSPWQPTLAAPYHLYVQDFDGNGQVDALFEWSQNGRSVPMAFMDELSSQMVRYRKQFAGSYQNFAKAGFEDVLPISERSTAKTYLLERVQSGCWSIKNGTWNFQAFPDAVQHGPVMAMAKGTDAWMYGGNWSAWHPWMGRVDGLSVGLLSSKSSVWAPKSLQTTPIQGEVRHIAFINGKWLMVRNNQAPIYSPKTNNNASN